MNNQLIQPTQPPRQTNWLFIIIALLIASTLGIGVFAYQYWQIREELLAQTQQVENLLEQIDYLEQQIEDLEAVDWQVYQGSTIYSDEDRFSVSYPAANWTLEENLEVVSWSTLYSKKYEGCNTGLGVGGHGVTPDWTRTAEGMVIADKEAIKQIWRDANGKLGLIVVSFQKDDSSEYMFELSLPPDNQQECIESFDQILSTFKFID